MTGTHRGRRALMTSGLAAVTMAFAFGCSSIRVSTDYDPAFDFASFTTYSWLNGNVAVEGSSAETDNTLIDSRIRRAVNSDLQARGYRLAEPSKASFLVSYHIGVEQKLDVNTIQSGYGYGWGPGLYGSYSETQVRQYEEGTLLIDFIEPANRQLVWRGSGKARLRDSRTPEQREARINEAVAAILEKFPPQVKK